MLLNPENTRISRNFALFGVLTLFSGSLTGLQMVESHHDSSIPVTAEAIAKQDQIAPQIGTVGTQHLFYEQASQIQQPTTTTLPPTSTSTTILPETVYGSENVQMVDLGNFTATCYNLEQKGSRGGPGSIAVDPNVIPMGTELEVEGYGVGQARDTGGAIRGRRIDVWKASLQECREWGRRVIRVFMRTQS